MVARILTPKTSSVSVLDYNEEKVAEGNAKVIAAVNLPDNSMASIYDTFDEYESNPSIAEQFKKKSFHLAINPGPMDKITEEQTIECIHEVMREMGYGEQPYVIYKHFDIERTHFHVVSTRVNKNGRRIDNNHEGRIMASLMKGLEQKYGFTMGSNLSAAEESNLPVQQTKEFVKGQPNVMYSLKVLFEEALKYDFHSLYQFGCIMLAMNVRISMRKRKDGGDNFVVQGLDDKGKKATRLYSLEKQMGYQAADAYERRLAENKAMGHLQLDRKVAIKELSDYCLENTTSAVDYCSALEEAGVRHIIQRAPGTDEIKRVTLVEKNTYSLVDTAVRGELFLKSFQEAEKSGRWEKPAGGRNKPKPGAKVRKKDAQPFFNVRRGGEVKERIERAITAYRGATDPRKLPGVKKIGRGRS